MTISKRNITTFTNNALGQAMATKLAESYVDKGWTVQIKTTSLHITVEAEWGCTVGEEGE